MIKLNYNKNTKITYKISLPPTSVRRVSKVRKTLQTIEVVNEMGTAISRHQWNQLFNL